MAIFVLERDIDDLIALPEVYNGQDYSTEIGPQFTLMGWGDYGPIGEEPSRTGVFHAGRNVFERIESEMLVYSMDSKANGGLEMEALAWDGDDGGPALIKNGFGRQ